MDCSLPGSSVHGIFQARVPEWGAIASSYPSFFLVQKPSSLGRRYVPKPELAVLLSVLSMPWTYAPVPFLTDY